MSSAPEALQVHYTADSVHRGVDALVSKDVDIQQSITQMKTQLLDIAATFQDLGAMDRVCLSQYFLSFDALHVIGARAHGAFEMVFTNTNYHCLSFPSVGPWYEGAI